jgi:hypothetical protein
MKSIRASVNSLFGSFVLLNSLSFSLVILIILSITRCSIIRGEIGSKNSHTPNNVCFTGSITQFL